RNLTSFETDIKIAENLIHAIPKEKIAIAESGISSVETIVHLRQAGYHGFLIGENFMKTEEPVITFENFAKEVENRLSTNEKNK
ncbi:MAG: indole-3-glycerol-phosphate synthase TrpC, partial [Chitinophagaceae bacterium]|nr:indole-3-glycerol-phosphate synthase TrpC [Chitinophagaceae bacterium]